eukprot:SM000390S14727  [mRNA]  locus=s390:53116:53331:+ [translate_table: standard]
MQLYGGAYANLGCCDYHTDVQLQQQVAEIAFSGGSDDEIAACQSFLQLATCAVSSLTYPVSDLSISGHPDR